MPETTEATATPDLSYSDLRAILSGEKPEPAAAPEPAKAAEETPAPETSAAPETPAPEPAPASEPDNNQESQPAQPNPGKGGFQRRIDKLTAKVHELERQLAKPAAQPGETSSTPAPAQTELKKPEPPNPSTWTGTWDELENAKLKYAEELADYKVQQALSQRERADQERQARAQQEQAAKARKERAA